MEFELRTPYYISPVLFLYRSTLKTKWNWVFGTVGPDYPKRNVSKNQGIAFLPTPRISLHPQGGEALLSLSFVIYI